VFSDSFFQKKTLNTGSLDSKYTKKYAAGGQLGRKRIFVYLKPEKRVWWLQMSFFPLGANIAPQIP